MRTCMLATAVLALSVSCAHAVSKDVGSGAAPEPKAPTGYTRVPMEFMGSPVKRRGRWINVHGVGKMYLAPGFPNPFMPCTADTPVEAKCYDEIDPP